jgi:hypothetical protein
MEMNFRFIVMLAGCFVIYLFLPSCSNSQNFKGKPSLVLNGQINITDYDTSDSTLTLQDTNGNNAYWVVVTRKKTVNWNLTSSTASKIVITDISKDTNFAQNDSTFFSTDPHTVGSTDHWQAVIGDPAGNKGTIEKYWIRWKLKSGGPEYIFDPLLQLNPH